MSPVLGKFTLLDDYFAHTDMPGRLSKFDPDQYRTPYLKQAIRRRHHDAISAFVREHVGQSQRAAAQTIAALTDLTQGHSVPQQTEPNASGSAADACARLAEALPRTGSAGSPRWLVVNPLSFTRRIGVELPEASQALAVTGPVVAAGSAGSRHFAVVETPALGFAWIEPSQKPTVTNAKPIAVGNKLTNEFLEVTVSNATGGIQSLYDFSHRGNQLSQQVAYRLPGPTGEPGMGSQDTDEGHYSSMRAEQVEITASCPAFGEIVSRGTLVAGDGRTLAGFRQTIQLWAGSRVITLEVELDAVEEPRADPWNSYCALRFAWPLETAELWRGVGLVRERTGASRLEAPEYIEIESLSGHVTLLTGGLPYHRRDAGRMLDSLLVVRGERERRFHVGIGVSLPQPAAAALEFLTPQTVQRNDGPPGSTDSGWFFHLDAKNVVATHWEPLVDADAPTTGATGGTSPVIGFRARLLETAGRAGRVTLRTFRPVAKARQVDFLGQTLLQAPVDGDKITLDFGSQEWIEVEATWAG
jgi:alpha-mannosidase